MRRILLALAVLLGPAIAVATQAPSPLKYKFGCPSGIGVNCFARTAANIEMNDVAANAAAASQTFVLDVAGAGVSTVSVILDITEVGAITAATLTCSVSPNGGATYGQLTSTTVAAGVGTVVAYSDSYAITATGVVGPIDFDVARYDKFKCLVGITGGGATDTYDVHVTGSAP